MVHEVELKPGWFQADLDSAAQRLKNWNGYDFKPQKSQQNGVATQTPSPQPIASDPQPKPTK